MDERIERGDGWYNTSSPISLSNTLNNKPDKKITFFIQDSSSYFPCQLNWMDEEYMETNWRSNIITLYIHVLYIGRS